MYLSIFPVIFQYYYFHSISSGFSIPLKTTLFMSISPKISISLNITSITVKISILIIKLKLNLLSLIIYSNILKIIILVDLIFFEVFWWLLCPSPNCPELLRPQEKSSFLFTSTRDCKNVFRLEERQFLGSILFVVVSKAQFSIIIISPSEESIFCEN